MCIMEKILCLIVFMLSCFTIHAQSQNQQEEIKALVQRVDSLEHELSYLKLSYELNTLYTDMTMLTSQVEIKLSDIKMDIYHRNFNPQFVDMYQRYYESCQGQKQAFSKNIEATKELFFLKVMTHSYSETELSVLNASYERIDKVFESLETTIDYFKAIADVYAKDL